MATPEERLSSLEGDYATVVQGITIKLDEQAGLLRELHTDVHEQGQDMREMKARLATMDMRMAMVDTRLNRMDERLDSLTEEIRSNAKEMRAKFDQIISLLAERRGT